MAPDILIATLTGIIMAQFVAVLMLIRWLKRARADLAQALQQREQDRMAAEALLQSIDGIART